MGLALGGVAVLDSAISFEIDFARRVGRVLGGVPYLVALGFALVLCLVFLGGIVYRRWGGDRVLLFFLVITVFPFFPFVGTVTLLAIYWLLFLRTASGERWEPVGTPLFYAFLLFYVGMLVVSSVQSDLVTWAAGTAKRLLQAAFLLLLVITLRKVAQLRYCLACYFWAGTASAVAGVAQALAFNQTGVILFPPDVIEWSRSPLGVMPRSTGFFANANWFGSAMVGLAVYMSWLGFCGGAYYGRGKRSLLLMGAAVAMGGALFSASRASWLAIIIALVVMPIVRRPAITLHYALGMLALAGTAHAFGLIESVLIRAERLRPAAVEFRFYVAELAWEAITENPWLGVGMRGLDGWNNPFRLPAHNMILDVASEMGVLAGVGTVIWIVSLLIRALLSLRRGSHRREAVFLQGAMVSFVAMVIYDQFDVFFGLKQFWFHMGLLEASILVCSGRGLPDTARPIFGR